ncbi:extracellular solute-binding protein [Micromonospora sp. NPDC092111]|uniref:extracellular solute-binding protein n=1 Tax=Micromonospora sp. NPDC092111 TaxID=3364289 RepID=UPI003830E618
MTTKTGISVWLSDPASYKMADQPDIAVTAAREFNEKHPEYLVEIKAHDFYTMPGIVAQAAEQGTPPDVAEFHFTLTRTMMDALGSDGAPLFTPIERVIAGRTEILGEPVVLESMLPAARDFFRYAGELVSMPRTASTLVLYANMTILNRAGVTKPPRTWREVEAACEAVAKLSDGPSHGIAWPNCYWFFLQSVAQQGGLIADHDNGRSARPEKVNLASDEMMAYVEWWQRLHQNGHYLYTGVIGDFPGCFEAFENQEVALLITSSVDATHLMQRGERHGFTVEAGRMPYNDEVRFAGNSLGGFSLWLASGLSKEKQDGALAFMQYLNNPRNVAEWAKLHWRIPITKPSLDFLAAEDWFVRNPNLQPASDQAEETDGSPASFGPLMGDHAAIVGKLTSAMHDVLINGAEPIARFASASEEAQQSLEGYNSYCDGPPRRTPRDYTVSI